MRGDRGGEDLFSPLIFPSPSSFADDGWSEPEGSGVAVTRGGLEGQWARKKSGAALMGFL